VSDLQETPAARLALRVGTPEPHPDLPGLPPPLLVTVVALVDRFRRP